MPSASIILNSATAGTLSAQYVEPTTNVDGSPITNLKQTNISVSFDAGSTFVMAAIDLASAPAGGGARYKTVPGLGIPASASSAIVRLVAENTAGFKSDAVDITVAIARPIPNPVN